MSRQPEKSSKCKLKHETEEAQSLVSREPIGIDRRSEEDSHWNQLVKSIAIESEHDQNTVEENNQKKKSKKNLRRSTLDFKEAYNILQKMNVEKVEEDDDIIKGEIKGKSFEGQQVKYIIVDRGKKTNPMLTFHFDLAANKIVKFLLVGKEKCPLCRPDNKIKDDLSSQVSKKAVNCKYKTFCDLMESITFTDCIYNKIKNNTHTHEATITTNFKWLAEIVDQIIGKKERKKGNKPLFIKGEILGNINWKFLQGASKITVVVREKGKHGPTLEINTKKDEISFIIKCRIKDPLNVKIHPAIKEVNNGASNQAELVAATIDSEEAPENLVMTDDDRGGVEGIASMTKKDDTATGIMPARPEVVRASSSNPEEVTKENDNNIPDQSELVMANIDSEEALDDNLLMTGGMQGINSMTKRDDTTNCMSSKSEVVLTNSHPKKMPDNVMTREMQAINSMTKGNNNNISDQPELVTEGSDSEEAPNNLVMT